MKKVNSEYSRIALINKIVETEKSLSDDEINPTLKVLYHKRYLNLIEELSKKVKELNI